MQPGAEMISAPMSTLTVQPGAEMVNAPMTIPMPSVSMGQGLNDAALEAATRDELQPPTNVE